MPHIPPVPPVVLAFLAGLALGTLTTSSRRSLDLIRWAAPFWRLSPKDIETLEMDEEEMTEILEAHDPTPTPPRLRRAK